MNASRRGRPGVLGPRLLSRRHCVGGVLTPLLVPPGSGSSRVGGRGVRALGAEHGRVRVSVLLAIAVGVVLAVVLLTLASRTDIWRNLGSSKGPVALRGLSEVTRKSSIRFPAGAVLLDGEFQGGISQYIIAKVSMPASRVSQFAAQPPFSRRGGLSSTERAFTNADGLAMVQRGWDPDGCRRFLSGEGTPSNYPEIVRFVIDMDDPKTVVMYFEWDSA